MSPPSFNWSAEILFRGQRSRPQNYMSSARDTDFRGVRKAEGRAGPWKTQRRLNFSLCTLSSARVHTSDLKALLPYHVVLKLATSSHVCIHDFSFVLEQLH